PTAGDRRRPALARSGHVAGRANELRVRDELCLRVPERPLRSFQRAHGTGALPLDGDDERGNPRPAVDDCGSGGTGDVVGIEPRGVAVRIDLLADVLDGEFLD